MTYFAKRHWQVKKMIAVVAGIIPNKVTPQYLVRKSGASADSALPLFQCFSINQAVDLIEHIDFNPT